MLTRKTSRFCFPDVLATKKGLSLVFSPPEVEYAYKLNEKTSTKPSWFSSCSEFFLLCDGHVCPYQQGNVWCEQTLYNVVNGAALKEGIYLLLNFGQWSGFDLAFTQHDLGTSRDPALNFQDALLNEHAAEILGVAVFGDVLFVNSSAGFADMVPGFDAMRQGFYDQYNALHTKLPMKSYLAQCWCIRSSGVYNPVVRPRYLSLLLKLFKRLSGLVMSLKTFSEMGKYKVLYHIAYC